LLFVNDGLVMGVWVGSWQRVWRLWMRCRRIKSTHDVPSQGARCCYKPAKRFEPAAAATVGPLL
jgi:hypothetical protein